MFKPFELSRWRGRPGHLFVFALGPLAWRFASGDRPVVLSPGEPGEQVFHPAPIERSPIKETSQRAKNDVSITMPCRLDPTSLELTGTAAGEALTSFTALWRPFPPSGVVTVTCLSYHEGDPDRQTQVEWLGRVAQPQFTDTVLTLTCQPSRSRAQFTGMGRRWQRGCDLALYSKGPGLCNVDQALHVVPATLSSVEDLLHVGAAAFASAPKPLAGGFVEWTRPSGVIERRSVMAHDGSMIELNYGALDLTPGLEVNAYPGCPHNWAGCKSFDNTPNYGGEIYLPVKNLFNGNPVW